MSVMFKEVPEIKNKTQKKDGGYLQVMIKAMGLYGWTSSSRERVQRRHQRIDPLATPKIRNQSKEE